LVSADVPSLLSEASGNPRLSNCGLNVAAFTLTYFQKPHELAKLSDALHLGKGSDRAVSLTELRDLLKTSDLAVEGYEQATLQDVSQELSNGPGALAIVHLKTGPGHFVVLAKSPGGRLVIIDVDSSIKWTTLRELDEEYRNAFSGVFLLVRQIDALNPPTFSLDQNDIKFSIGSVKGRGILSVSMWMKNPTKKPVSLKQAKGGCSCFTGAVVKSPDGKTIAPGESKEIVFTFKKEALGLSDFEKEILLSFDGFPQEWIKVNVRGQYIADALPLDCVWYPEMISLGIVRSNMKPATQSVVILAAPGTHVLSASSTSDQLVVKNLTPKVPDRNDLGQEAYHFTVDAASFSGTALHEKIVFQTDDPASPLIEIPISGEFRR
jgi:hypothetical protein